MRMNNPGVDGCIYILVTIGTGLIVIVAIAAIYSGGGAFVRWLLGR